MTLTPRTALPRFVQIALGATIVLVALASGSVHALVDIATPLRWAALGALAILAALWARSEGVSATRLAPVAVPAALLGVLALASTLWSVSPGKTLERSVAFGAVLVAAGAIAAVDRGLYSARLVAHAVVVATTALCLAGPIVYAFVPAEARQVRGPINPFRWSGIGENPNTLQMLAALASVLAVWLALSSSGRGRVGYAAAFVVLGAQVLASGARDGAIGVAIGAFVFALVAPRAGRQRTVAVCAAAGLAATLIGGIALLNSTALPPHAPAQASAPGSAPAPAPRTYPKLVLPPLDSEFGTVRAVPRTLLLGGGRAQAVREAYQQGSERPVAGWGFGTETRVFINRVTLFRSDRVENSYLGLFLELGVFGPLLWIAVGIGLVVAVLRALGRLEGDARLALAGLAGVVAAGYALGIGQSYVYAAGNVATLTFWLVAFLAAAVVGRPHAPSRLAPALAAGIALLVAVSVAGRVERSDALTSARTGIARIWNRVGERLDGKGLDGFRGQHPIKCFIYAAGADPTAYELCFQNGRLIEAIDRCGGGFHAWTLQPFGPQAATISVSPAAVDDQLRRLGAFLPEIMPGPGYIVRRAP